MYKRLFIFSFLLFSLGMSQLNAGITTYTFTSAKWASTVGATKCDGTTDGWVSQSDATEYCAGRTDAKGQLYSKGVGVKTGTSGAGATSVQSFTKVRRITVNFCQNSSKGKGVIYFQIGANTPDSLVINKPAKSEQGEYNRDSVITIAEKTGKIKFWITCSENAIYLNTLSIRAEEGGSNPFTESTYQLVTDVRQLQDSDQIIFGIADGMTNKVMGYFDESVSQNNIHAINARYSDDRTMVNSNDEAIYTLHKTTNKKGDSVFVFQDELRYELAFLVASGGQTKNRLALWTKYTSDNYGEYGLWTIQISPTGEATICSQGNSLGKYISYNASDKLFGCYSLPDRFTSPCIYRKTPALGTDKPAIAASMVNFGEVCLRDSSLSGSRTLTVNATRLTGDIQASLRHSDIYQLSTSTLDRDGDQILISYQVSQAGNYIDTLLLSSPDTSIYVPIMLRVAPQLTVAQAVHQADYASTYLGDVVVTKKYDKYIFVRDTTGSMLIYDANDAQGKPYGQGLKNGDVLHHVHGRFQNYYGVPEMTPVESWSVQSAISCEPDTMLTTIDSTDVCRYVRIPKATVEQGIYNGCVVKDAFNTGVIEDVSTTLDAIVMISYDNVQLWVVRQEINSTNSISNTEMEGKEYEKFMLNGHWYIRHGQHIYSTQGQMVH